MDQYLEFVGNHPILFAALVAVLGMIGWMEYERIFSGVKTLSPMEATRLQNDEDAVFVDVREESEFKAGHIFNSRHIPSSAFDKRIGELDKVKKKPIIVYCTNGPRASRAAGKLRKKEFESVYTIAGGLGGWEKAGMPLSTKSKSKAKS